MKKPLYIIKMVSLPLDKMLKSLLSERILLLLLAILIGIIAFCLYRYFRPVQENFQSAPAVLSVDPAAASLMSAAEEFMGPVQRRESQVSRIRSMESLCYGYTQPIQLEGKKSIYPGEGCGWYFFEDYDKISFPAYGNAAGPLNPDTKKRGVGGVWLFGDMGAAQIRENKKRCSRIRTCQLADLFGTDCGWCESLGYGIPIDGKAMRYPEDDKTYCFEDPVLNVAKCPIVKSKQTGLVEVDENGKKIEAEIVPPPLCELQSGILLKACRLFLCENVGISIRSPVYRMINGDPDGFLTPNTKPHRKFFIAWEIMKFRGGIPYDKSIFETGECTRDAALSYFKRLQNESTGGVNPRTKDVATYLVTEDGDYKDSINLNSTGPFSIYTLQTKFIDAGGTEQGSWYPIEQRTAQWAGFTMKSIMKTMAKECGDNISSDDPKVQAAALKRCLGMDIERLMNQKIKGEGDDAKKPPTDAEIAAAQKAQVDSDAAIVKSNAASVLAMKALKAAQKAAQESPDDKSSITARKPTPV